MIKLPRWIQETFDESSCPFPKCKAKSSNSGVMAVGVRHEKADDEDGLILSFFYEYQCPKCGKRSVFTGFPTKMEDFIADMIEISNFTPDSNYNYRKNAKSKITPAELENAKRMLRKSKNYKDFMGFFGIIDLGPEDKNENQ